MATLYPSEDKIEKDIVEREKDGEIVLIAALNEKLDDSYEIYYKPFLNGDVPDLIILREGYGAYVIEIKDIDLDDYSYDAGNSSNDFGKLINNATNFAVPTPYEQVEWYKNNLYNSHAHALTIANLCNPSLYSAIKTAVYFTNATNSQIAEKFASCLHRDRIYIKAWGNDNINNIIDNIKFDLDRRNGLCSDEVYQEMQSILKPKFTETTATNEINLSNQQVTLSQSKAAQQIKITGPVGCGKTVVLAKRAVNAYERTNERVLILCYNVPLINYIEDKISYFDNSLPRDMFLILHFHGFILQQLYRHTSFKLYWTDTDEEMLEFEEIFPVQDISDVEEHFPKRELLTAGVFDKKNILDMDEINKFLEDVKDMLPKFDTILIDEVQEFEYEWLQCIKTYFLKPKGEYVLVGQETHSFSNKTKKIKTNVKGKWNNLSVPYRFSYAIDILANEFQRTFLNNKYEIYHPVEAKFLVPDSDCVIKYHFFEELQLEELYSILAGYVEDYGIRPEEISIVAHHIAKLRGFEQYYLSYHPEQNIHTSFESKYQFDHLKRSQKLYRLRKIKKSQFRIEPDALKLSTIHNFKGYESDTLFLILEGRRHRVTDELIYKAINKCRKNLIVININDYSHHEFFENNI
ncbi:MAG: hypothetical protein ATN33_03580 [Epulopiscium sp. Nele67-Bin001]|nr:MAG: hypothetical protein ATN33_03580 [Epulopiscium sp. Nele67-Bin001]